MQFMRELSRVSENPDIRKAGREKWIDWAVRILALAEKHDSGPVKKMYESYKQEDECDSEYHHPCNCLTVVSL